MGTLTDEWQAIIVLVAIELLIRYTEAWFLCILPGYKEAWTRTVERVFIYAVVYVLQLQIKDEED